MLPPPSRFWQRRRKLIIVGFLIGALAIVSLGGFWRPLARISVPSYYLDTIVYASLFGLMAIGLTLTYLTTKVPNFAYGSFVTIGIYTSFTLFKLDQLDPYVSTLIAFLIGAVSSVGMYLGILRVLARRGSYQIHLMIATLAIDIAFLGVFGIFSDYLTSHFGIRDSKKFFRLRADFSLFGTPGVLFVAPISLALITATLYLFLNRTRFGIAMRASVESPSLARVLGIDVERAYVFAWFLAGGFAATAGSFSALWLQGGTTFGSGLIVEIFAASVLGGLASIYGAAVGGLIIGATEILLTQAGIAVFGSWISIYQKGFPLLIMVITLLLFPRGLVSIDWHRIRRAIVAFVDLIGDRLGEVFRFVRGK